LQGTVAKVVLIKIFTDEGVVGVADSGACYPDGVQDVILTMMKVWEPTLIGANPLDREFIIARLNTYLYNDMIKFPLCRGPLVSPRAWWEKYTINRSTSSWEVKLIQS
jgi:hypothetical protein